MPTVSDTFSSASWSGTGYQWQNLSGITNDTGAAYNNYNLAFTNLTDLLLSKPNALDGLANGSRLTNININFLDKADGGGSAQIEWGGYMRVGSSLISFTGGSKSHILSSSYTAREYDGDLTYWGMNAYDPKDVLISIRDGWLKLYYYSSPGATSGTAYINDVFAEMTYEEVDTKRAAIKACVP